MLLNQSHVMNFQDERKFVLNGLSLKNLGVLAGLGSGGKSFFILDFALRYVLKLNHFLTKIEPEDRKKILFISNEDDEYEISKRIRQCLNNIYVKNKLFDNNNEISVYNTQQILKTIFDNLDIEILEDAAKIYDYLNKIEPNKYDLIIFDTFTSIFDVEDENSNSEVSKFIKKIKKILVEKNSAGLIIHHLNQSAFSIKDSSELNYSLIRGATALINNCRYGAILHNFEKQQKTFYAEVKANAIKKQTYQIKHNIYINGVQLETQERKGGRIED
jgi:RecA-family ATPase